MVGPAPGPTVAVWGPEVKVGVPQPALTIDTDAETNVEHLDFRFENDRGTTPVVYVQEPLTKVPGVRPNSRELWSNPDSHNFLTGPSFSR